MNNNFFFKLKSSVINDYHGLELNPQESKPQNPNQTNNSKMFRLAPSANTGREYQC